MHWVLQWDFLMKMFILEQKSLLDELVIMFGGYAAESIVYSDTTTGSQNDIRQATNLARKMVCEWGMSDEIGAVSYGQED